MKRFGRFIKWCFSGMGWFEWYMSSVSICLGAGITATVTGNDRLRDFWFTAACVLALLAMLVVVGKGILHAWSRFKEDDEKMFNILKEKDLK